MSWLSSVLKTLYVCRVLFVIQGNVQVFYRDLPLSIQEGYEHFLSRETVTLHQYQVCLSSEWENTLFKDALSIFCHSNSSKLSRFFFWDDVDKTTETKKSEIDYKSIPGAPLNIRKVSFVFFNLGFWTFEKAWVCCEQIWPQVTITYLFSVLSFAGLYQLFYRMISCSISILSSNTSNKIIFRIVQSRPHMRGSWICQHHQGTNRENSWRGSALLVLCPGTCDVSHRCFFFRSCSC